MSKRPDSLEHALHTSHTWLNSVAEALGTTDHQLAYRALRAWLHTFRDRLTVDVAANFAAQLPELLRGVYYEGWDPSTVPVKYDREAFTERFAREAIIPVEEVPDTLSSITAGLHQRLSPGQLELVLQQFPHDVRALLQPLP
ncbi:DUF2267 domain-containing protein [Streptomyces sodiiphilus]|uniref:DUF2267 domain-containing protein n=1 Tax=Streptomyces sodiiphilus TaxID=226217 RepID=A0ABN2NS89_9ACTN